ncbi:MAG: cytochrome-c peroxidase, partial [Ghiorsea sp.]|nr:cytochrome-c peroxidase [Ghiorsea sp.]
AFERSLITPNSRFDQYMRGDKSALSISEKEGLDEFKKAGCAKCHNGAMFSDFKMHVLGVQENDKLSKIDSGFNNTFAFRTPTLRNLQFTFPYMHNGTFNSLKEILEFYEDLSNGKSRNSLVPKDSLDILVIDMDVGAKNMSKIISFLNALNDEDFDKSIPERVPSGLPVGGNI